MNPEVRLQEGWITYGRIYRYKLRLDDYDASNKSLFNLNYLGHLPCFPFLSLCCFHESWDINPHLHLSLLFVFFCPLEGRQSRGHLITCFRPLVP